MAEKHPLPQVTLFFDGATRGGNPGLGGAAAVIQVNDDNDNTRRVHNRMGLVGNNCAEYYGLILGLREILHMFPSCPFDLMIKGDSDLVIKQLGGEFQVRDDVILGYHLVAAGLLERIGKIITTSLGLTMGLGGENKSGVIKLRRIPREQNTAADDLAKAAAKRNVHHTLRFFHYPCLNSFIDGSIQGPNGSALQVEVAHDNGAAAYTPQVYVDAAVLQKVNGSQALTNLRSTGQKILMEGRTNMTILGITSLNLVFGDNVRISVYDALVVDYLPWPLQISVKHPSFKNNASFDINNTYIKDWKAEVPERYRKHHYWTSNVNLAPF